MIDHHEEAEICRRRALAYLGCPEASLLLRLASEFDRLAIIPKPSPDKRQLSFQDSRGTCEDH